jgi:predicted methyltransferase
VYKLARDPVLVVEFEGGGLISYLREAGTLMHTLNTAEGFRRKLRQLGVELKEGTVGS